MIQNAQQRLDQLYLQKKNNLEFFKQYFPNIFKGFSERDFENARLNIDPDNLEVELVENNKAVYGGKPSQYAKDEAKLFSKAFDIGKYNLPLRHHYVGEFLSGRFFHCSLENFMRDIGAEKNSASPYIFEYSLPQVVVFGSGLGQHIEELLKIRDIRHLVLIEHNPNHFLASLLITDWKAIIQPYIDDQTKSFTISVGDTSQADEDARVHTAFGTAWGQYCNNVPFMPVQTVFYNHLSNPIYAKAINKLNKEIEAYINVWGYYDDEVNQLNHVLHNLKNNIPVMSKVDFSHVEKPILVCGNGPSLDNYISIIKENRDKVIVISAGSTTYTLLANDIYPDAVVTVESDLVSYEAFKLLPPEKAKKTHLIGAAQIHPHTFNLFDEKLLYFKAETAYSAVFGNQNERIADGTPSATNAALALIIELKFKNIFLIGLDYGYVLGKESHAKDSFYLDDKTKEIFTKTKAELNSDAYKVEENQFGEIYTNPFYNTSRSHAERKIRVSGRTDITNLSKGATIEKAAFDEKPSLINSINSVKNNNSFNLIKELKEHSRTLKPKEIKKGVKEIHTYIKTTATTILKLVNDTKPNTTSIEENLFLINQELVGRQSIKNGNHHMMLRGTIWYWLFNYYAYIKKIDKQNDIEEITDKWKKHFSSFLKKLPEHMLEYIQAQDTNDEKLQLTIRDAEPNLEKWLGL